MSMAFTKTTKKNNLDLLRVLMTLNDDDLHDYLIKVLMSKYDTKNIYEDIENYIVAVGDDSPVGRIGFVSHMDTVFKVKPKFKNIKEKNGILYNKDKSYGLGADDRAGIFMILQILNLTNIRPTIIFTHLEEVGGIGATALSNDKPMCEVLSKHLDFMIEIDRKGNNEVVYYQEDNKDFHSFIESYGFVANHGSYSDIVELSPAFNVASCNVSAGYYGAHTKSETINIKHMQNTFDKIINILNDRNLATERLHYPHTAVVVKYGSYGGYGKSTKDSGGYGYYNDYAFDFDPIDYGYEVVECKCCRDTMDLYRHEDDYLCYYCLYDGMYPVITDTKQAATKGGATKTLDTIEATPNWEEMYSNLHKALTPAQVEDLTYELVYIHKNTSYSYKPPVEKTFADVCEYMCDELLMQIDEIVTKLFNRKLWLDDFENEILDYLTNKYEREFIVELEYKLSKGV